MLCRLLWAHARAERLAQARWTAAAAAAAGAQQGRMELKNVEEPAAAALASARGGQNKVKNWAGRGRRGSVILVDVHRSGVWEAFDKCVEWL
jgi:hypothetical protein